MLIDARTEALLDELREKWQNLLDVLQGVTGVPAALVMRVHTDEIEVFARSRNDANVYKEGERAGLGTGLYCETVMRSRAELLVPDALTDPQWQHNPDIEVGMISYLGLPVAWPSGDMFGTICVLDSEANKYSPLYRSLLEQFRGAVELDLASVVREAELHRSQVELSEQRAALARANAELDDFAYVTSHDLSEPLRAITWYVGRLLEHLGEHPDEEAVRYGELVIDATTRLRQMIDDLLEFSRVGRTDQTVGDVVLADLVEETRAFLTPLIAESNASVQVDALPTVRSSRIQQAQLLRNLIANAIKFARPGQAPQIRIGAQRRDYGDWEVHVDDNGIGIEEAQRERVFEMFRRLHGPERAGTGMGLAICKKIVVSNGGRIWVTDSPLGGSSFRYTVAAVPDGERPPDVD